MSAAVSEPGPATPAEIGEGLEALCGWAAGLDIADIPEPVRQRAVLILADDIAAIVAARDEPQVRALQARQVARSGQNQHRLGELGKGHALAFNSLLKLGQRLGLVLGQCVQNRAVNRLLQLGIAY